MGDNCGKEIIFNHLAKKINLSELLNDQKSSAKGITDNPRSVLVFRKTGSLVFISICYALCEWSTYSIRKNHSCQAKSQEPQPLVGQDDINP